MESYFPFEKSLYLVKKSLYTYINKIIDIGYSLLDRISIKQSIVIFMIGSIGDIVTTWYGYSNGLSEFSPFVELLLVNLGSISGAIVSKAIAVLIILVIGLTTTVYWATFSDKDYKNTLREMMRDLLVIGGFIYLGASLNNLVVIFLYLS